MSEPVPPKKLAVYYGWPIAVNGTWSVASAISVFDDYDLVVFGAGLEDPAHDQYQSTKDIIDGTTADVYGYVDSTLSPTNFETAVDNWSVMGGSTKTIVGIFCDQFGFDFGLIRTKQNDEVDYIHGKSLIAFVNAWDPDDVFKKVNGPNGGDTHMTATDWYLAESYQVINGAYQNANDWEVKADKMKTFKDDGPGFSQIATITTNDASAYDQAKWDYSYYSCALYGFDAAGWGEQYFSASSASMPFRTRKSIQGTNVIGNISDASGVFERSTNIGIQVDVNNHTVSDQLA